MRWRLLALVLTLAVLGPAMSAGVPFPRLLLQTPYQMQAAFGKPDRVVGKKARGGAEVVEWRYLTHKKFDQDLGRTVGSTCLRVVYTGGRVTSIFVAPGSRFSSSPRDYIPSNVVFKVRSYDDIGRMIGSAQRPFVKLAFSNPYVRGTCRLLVAPLKIETLQPSGRFTTRYDFARVWAGQTLSAQIELQPRFRQALMAGRKLPPAVLQAVGRMPVKK